MVSMGRRWRPRNYWDGVADPTGGLFAGRASMSKAFLFWLIMVLWLLFGLWVGRPTPGAWAWQPLSGTIILWLLLFMLGWKVFGFPIHG